MNAVSMRWHFAVLLITFVALQGCTFPVKQMEFTAIEGRVIDAETGAPIEGAVVYVHWQEGKESLAERYAAGTLFAAEAVTDETGRFSLPSGGPGTVSFSRHLHYNSPLIGIIKAGYGVYHTTLQHKTSYGFPNRQIHDPSPGRCCTFELKRMSVREIAVGEGSSHSSFASTDLEQIARSDCWWENLPRTIRAMDALNLELRKLDPGVSLFSIDDIPSREECMEAQFHFKEIE